METVTAMVEGVSARHGDVHDAGMLSDDDVVKLKDAGLDYYNHNIDTSERYYSEVIKTHLCRPARHTGPRAGGRHEGLLRRHSSASARPTRTASTCW